MLGDALGLVELGSLARGYRALDALTKRSPVTVLEANLVEPGKFLLLFCGGVAEVEEAMSAALAVADGALIDQLLLPFAHAALLPALAGHVQVGSPDTLGVVEGRTPAATLLAADRALKDADVRLCGLRVSPGLGGRGVFVIAGVQHDVEAGLAAATAQLNARGAFFAAELIPRPSDELVALVLRPAPFNLSPNLLRGA
ncbi:MAG: BMC domain-containing protein [Deltaproteobacteria bacterium]|nr:BMC domain-containing protein [Deltaproteobacteria bacterium]MBK9645733.1 BMC domain-containing protein [Deltaproteobacteria bacterium]